MPCLHGKLAKLGGVVPYQLTVPVKIDGRQEQEENIGAIEPVGLAEDYFLHKKNLIL